MASLLEVAACGSSEDTEITRPKIVRTLQRHPALRKRLAESITPSGFTLSEEDFLRIDRVLEKIGRALWSFEVGEPTTEYIAETHWWPYDGMTPEEAQTFTSLNSDLFAELGSRLFVRQAIQGNSWITLQEGRFRYAVELSANIALKVVIGNYLAAQITLIQEL